MANLLALETSTDICSVSLSRGEEIFNFHQLMPKQHTENLFGIISGLFEESGLSFEKLDGVAVAVGPGSYTGVRLACSVAQGIAFSHDIKAVTLSSLELLSLEAHRNLGLERINCISAANQGKVYVAESSFVDGDIVTKMKLIDQESILRESFPENSHFIGEGCELLQFENQLRDGQPRASLLLEVAKVRFSKGNCIEAESILPIYFNDENSWKKII